MTKVIKNREQAKYASPEVLTPGTVYLDSDGDIMVRDDEGGATVIGADGVRVTDLDRYQVIEVYAEVVVR